MEETMKTITEITQDNDAAYPRDRTWTAVDKAELRLLLAIAKDSIKLHKCSADETKCPVCRAAAAGLFGEMEK
jgi:hypothetical protein